MCSRRCEAARAIMASCPSRIRMQAALRGVRPHPAAPHVHRRRGGHPGAAQPMLRAGHGAGAPGNLEAGGARAVQRVSHSAASRRRRFRTPPPRRSTWRKKREVGSAPSAGRRPPRSSGWKRSPRTSRTPATTARVLSSLRARPCCPTMRTRSACAFRCRTRRASFCARLSALRSAG